MESALIKYICGKDGSVSCSELLAVFPHDNYPTESLQDVTKNQDRFHLVFLDGQRTVIAKTKLRLCKAKDCRGCRNLHLCKQFLFGHCRFENDRQKGCYFGHEMFSEQNLRALRAHGLEDLDQTELCTLLLQNDNLLLPSVCHSYNNGVGEHGGCVDGDECKRLHICERYLRGRCTCSLHAHDFYEPHPRKTLLDWGVPSHILASIRAVYVNVEALRRAYREGRGGHQPGVHHAAMSHSNQGKTEVCPFFAKGSCKYGDKCFKDHSRYPSRQGSDERRPSNSRQGSNERQPSNSRQGSDERQQSNSRQGSDERQQSNSRQGSDERRPSNSRQGSNERRPSNSRQGSSERQQSNSRQGRNERRPSNSRQGSDERQQSNSRQGSDERQQSNSRQGSDERRPSNSRQGSNERRPSNSRQGSSERQQSNSRQGSDERQQSNSRQGSDERQRSNSRQGRNERRPSNSRQGSNERQQSNSRQGSNERQQSNSRQWRNERQQSNSRQGSDERQQSNSRQWMNERQQSNSRQGSSERQQSNSRQWMNERQRSNSRQWMNERQRSNSRQGRNERRPSNSRQGSNERQQSNSRQGSSERQQSNSRQGSNERQQSNSRQGSDERQRSNSRQGRNERRPSNSRQGSNERQQSNSRQGSNERQQSNSRQWRNERQQSNSRQGSDERQQSNSRQGSNERQQSNSRQGSDERQQSNSRQGSNERQQSNSRQGSDERQQSNSRQGRNERRPSNSSASDLTRHEDWEYFLESSVPTTLPPEDKRVYPPAAPGADTMETWLKRWRENSDKDPMVESEGEIMKAQMMALFEELQEARRKLREGEEAKANLLDRDHSIDRSPQLLNDHNQLNEQRADREVSKEIVDDLRTRLASAEQALVAKQQKIDTLMQEMTVFEAQAEVYASDFYSERAAREKIHEEKERLSAQLDCLKKQNDQLLRDMDSLGRQSLVDMRKRHSSQEGASASLFRDGNSRISQQKENIQGHACPMCAEIMPDLDSLEIHVIDCNP